MHTKRARKSRASFVNGLCFVFISGQSDKRRETAFIVALSGVFYDFLEIVVEVRDKLRRYGATVQTNAHKTHSFAPIIGPITR